MCCFCVHHVRVPTNVSEVHGSMILFTWKSLDPRGGHCIPEGVTVFPLILGGHWVPEGVTVSPLKLRGHWIPEGVTVSPLKLRGHWTPEGVTPS